jgi:2-polyprenyl-6-methoxyphenol hydroxylase-like FAD-dependent oxidoreductase
MSRPLLEWLVRRRVEALPNVELRAETTAVGLTTSDDGSRVTGVRLYGGGQLDCELAVDATGRQARTLAWLEDLGYAPPPTSVVEVDTRYVSRVFHRRDDDRDWQAAAVLDDPSAKRLAMLLPMEGSRWIMAIAGVNGETAPTDDAAMLQYLRGFGSSLIADVISESEPISDTVTHRFRANHRRHVERLRRLPLGWVLLGDAVCSFDPIYGQGMTAAALQAEALGRALDRVGRVDRTFARSYFRAAARIVNAPWSIAVGGDFAYDGTRGKKPAGTDVLNRYFDRLIDAGRCDDAVVVRLNEVLALARGPQALLAPSFVLRVLRAARRVDRACDRRMDRSPQRANASV